MKNVRWAVIAPGRISENFSAALKSVQGAVPFAVASRDKERSEAYAQKWGYQKAYGSYAEAFSDSEIDAVYIASLNMNHHELSIEALKAGKHVLCEKPATLTVAQLEKVLQTAKENKRFYMEALWTKFLPAYLHAQECIKSGKLGELKSIHASFLLNRPYSETTARVHDLELGGGALVDIGIYPLSFAFGLAKTAGFSVSDYSSFARLAESGADIEETISVQFKNGDKRALAHLWCSLDIEDSQKLNSAYIVGTKGRLRIPEFWRAQKVEFFDEETNAVESFEYAHAVNGFEYQIEESTRCILEGLLESPQHTHTESLHCMKVMQNLRHSYGVFYPADKEAN